MVRLLKSPALRHGWDKPSNDAAMTYDGYPLLFVLHPIQNASEIPGTPCGGYGNHKKFLTDV
jgi:hypothetical protein